MLMMRSRVTSTTTTSTMTTRRSRPPSPRGRWTRPPWTLLWRLLVVVTMEMMVEMVVIVVMMVEMVMVEEMVGKMVVEVEESLLYIQRHGKSTILVWSKTFTINNAINSVTDCPRP